MLKMMNHTISCFACKEPTSFKDEKSYKEHLLSVHGTTSPDQAMINEKNKELNSPKNLPIGIPPESLPTPEFIEAIKRIEEKPKKIEKLPIMQENPIITTIEVKPLVLEYQWTGSCPNCKFPVKTIMLNVGKRLFAVCWCSNENKSLLQKEVKPILKEEK